jgi:hypothetical protein
MKIKIINNVEFHCCPFCGKLPEVDTIGTQIEINCCCNMLFQKSDFLATRERELFDLTTCTYPNRIEYEVLQIAANKWNIRADCSSEEIN